MSNINDMYREMVNDNKPICHYMPLLRDYSKKYNDIAEIGHDSNGYTTVSISRSFPEKFVSYGKNIDDINSLINKFNIKVNIEVVPIIKNALSILSSYDMIFLNFYNCKFIDLNKLKEISRLARKTFIIYGILELEKNSTLNAYINHMKYNSIWEITKISPILSDVLIMSRKRVGCCSRKNY